MRIFAPLGMLGYGIPKETMVRGMGMGPDVLGADAGSLDPGPYYLGEGVSFTSELAVERDLGLILGAAKEFRVPVVIGSAGGAGANLNLERFLEIYQSLCRREGWAFRTAVISAEVEKEWVCAQVDAGRVRALDHQQELSQSEVARSSRIVGQMGFEPFLMAIDAGADVIIAGRAFDPAVMGAHALYKGFDKGLVVHMGKLLECGGAASEPRNGSDGLLATMTDDSFLVEPPNPARVCTVASVAAHSLYERSNPYSMSFPGGAIDMERSRFEQASERAVRVSGTNFLPAAEYTIKLEGAALTGYRAIVVAGVRDNNLIEELDTFLLNLRERLETQLSCSIDIDIKTFGRRTNTEGKIHKPKPLPDWNDYPLGLLFTIRAETPGLAHSAAALVRSIGLHIGYPNKRAISGNLAFPFAPSDVPLGPCYEFNIYHLVSLDNPNSLFSPVILN